MRFLPRGKRLEQGAIGAPQEQTSFRGNLKDSGEESHAHDIQARRGGLGSVRAAALSITAASTAAGASTGHPARGCTQVSESGTTVTASRTVLAAGLNCFTVSTTNPGQPGGGGGASVTLSTRCAA